jgi:anti-sigma regulatory factor (Ser/Thr protein kinase)
MAEIEINIPATRNGLATVLARIEEFAAARNLCADQVARVRVVVEELITNTIKYGYRGECDGPIRLRLSAGRVLTLVYEDQAPPFDPTLGRSEQDSAAKRLDGREGHAGIGLILGLSSTAAYEAAPEGNRLTLTFATGGADRA